MSDQPNFADWQARLSELEAKVAQLVVNDTGLAVQSQFAELREQLGEFDGRFQRFSSVDNLPEMRLLQNEKAIVLLAAILGEAKAEHFKSDITGLLPEISGAIAPLRARMEG